MRLSAPTGMILANASTLIGRTLRSLRRLASDRGGNVVMIFALVLPALVMITLGGIDLNRITTVKARVQDALDAATLEVMAMSSGGTRAERAARLQRSYTANGGRGTVRIARDVTTTA